MKRGNILNRIIEEHNKVIENLKNSVNRFHLASDLDENDTLDPDDFARQTEAKDLQMRFKQMLNEAERAHKIVLTEKTKEHTAVEEGAIIETSTTLFFVGLSIPHFSFEEKEVFCITKEAAIFNNLKGKNVGDEFEMGKNTLKIWAIY
ncbi:hypothetical protein EGI22_12425 [Lacihabitans sp. LS3-19]|uniref:hypothetical protein n=1 Tax=Lacihabitans sp. LS3-19 TaxID=2487335 RepID=UPI0020CE6784|nr:hypothetical protein [Lacihabitans sp. LS3-19]MCP9768723.1 hypothetical protein [Lacihabitans sp. LS3-19]